MVRVNPNYANQGPIEGELLQANDSRGAGARPVNEASMGASAVNGSAQGAGSEANANRARGERFAQAGATNNSTGANNTGSSRDRNSDAAGRMGDRFRSGADKLGNSIMMGAGGVAASLYLVLGWKTLAMLVGGLGVGAGYLLKSKVAKIGEKPDMHKQVADSIRQMEIPEELKKEILNYMQQKLGHAYTQQASQSFTDKARQAAEAAVKQAQKMASNSGFSNNGGFNPATAAAA